MATITEGVENLIWGLKLFDDDDNASDKSVSESVSQLWQGQWRASNVSEWQDVVIKVTPPGSFHSQQCKTEVAFFKVLSEIDPEGKFHMQLLHVIERDDEIVLIIKKGKKDVFEHVRSLQKVAIEQRNHDDDVVRCFRSMLLCVIALHTNGYSHNDIKPENFVLVEGVHKVALIDFGFSGRIKTPAVGSWFGTEMFLHPAICTFNSPTTAANDLFALGVSLFILFTMSMPAHSKATSKVLFHVRRSFVDGRWTSLPLSNPTIQEHPRFKACSDLINKLCKGQWRHANQEILNHPFFELHQST